MKRLVIIFLMMFFVSGTTIATAGERAPLGRGHFSAKVAYIQLRDDFFDRANIENGVYFGIDGYGEIINSLYLGAEIGIAKFDGTTEISGFVIDTDVFLAPVELNLKYVLPVTPSFFFDIGAGLSLVYVDERISNGYSLFE
jgi:hypothetical protein